MNNFSVSVWMIAYNHGPYIREAIESVLMQRTTFPVELVIGEDHSRDDTRAIIQDYCARYPGRVRLLEGDENLGMMRNAIRTLKACGGKYVAMCEGDDYWLDPDKLQKQFDFMEAHPDCALCFHAAHYKYLDPGKDFIHKNADEDGWIGVGDMVKGGGGFVPTASMFIRGDFTRDIPDWLERAFAADYPMSVLLAMRGRVRYINEAMSVYRREVEGSWTSGEWDFNRMCRFTWGITWVLMKINGATKGKYFGLLAGNIAARNWRLFKSFAYPVVGPFYALARKAGRGVEKENYVQNGIS